MRTKYSFVIHLHRKDDDVHWDLMLQDPNSDEIRFLTWRVPKDAFKGTNNQIQAQKIFDHPDKFLTYQGPLSAGKGMCRIVDRGEFEIIKFTDTFLQIRCFGGILDGEYVLEKIEDDDWRITKL